MGLAASLDDLCQESIARELVAKLRRPRFLWFDENSFRADFARDFGVDLPAPVELERSLLRQIGVISLPMVNDTDVVQNIDVGRQLKYAFRPPRYGRSLVVPYALSGRRGLLDVKGLGVQPGKLPVCANHGTGLLPLPMAIEEVVNQRIVESVLRKAGVNVRGVPIYGLIDLGISAKMPGAGVVPCAAIVRAPHSRRKGGGDLPEFGSTEQRFTIELELLLRKYGVTSTTPMTTLSIKRNSDRSLAASYGGIVREDIHSDAINSLLSEIEVEIDVDSELSFDAINIQVSRSPSTDPLRGDLYDFGHYHYVSNFFNPLISLVSDRPLNLGGVLLPEMSDFVSRANEGALNFAALQPKKLSTELASWFGVAANTEVTGAAYFGIWLSIQCTKKNLAVESFPHELDKFVARCISTEQGARVKEVDSSLIL